MKTFFTYHFVYVFTHAIPITLGEIQVTSPSNPIFYASVVDCTRQCRLSAGFKQKPEDVVHNKDRLLAFLIMVFHKCPNSNWKYSFPVFKFLTLCFLLHSHKVLSRLPL